MEVTDGNTKFDDGLGKMYQVTMEDGSVWEVPVILIACSHAEYYAKVDDLSFEEELKESSALFAADEYEIEDWAKNNMDWSDVEASAKCIFKPDSIDFEAGWINGEVKVV